VKKPGLEQDEEWPRGWDEHRFHQLSRMASLPFSEKLEWLEEAQALAEAIAAARHRHVGRHRPAPTAR
jgi:hypothetical protein